VDGKGVVCGMRTGDGVVVATMIMLPNLYTYVPLGRDLAG